METLSHLPIHVSTWWTDLSIPPGWAASAIEWSLAHPTPILLAAGWAVFCVAMLRVALAVDCRPHMVARQIVEADQAREEASR